MLAENQPLVSLGDQLSKKNSINKRPSSLAVDRYYAMAQYVMPKSSLEAISLGGKFIVVGILASIGINDNTVISGIPTCIPSPSNLWYVVNKCREDTFMRIAGVLFHYP